MKRIIAGGTGFIGQALVKRWVSKNIPLIVLGRSKSKIKKIFGDQVEAISWDEFEKHSKEYLNQSELILNLCGANIGDKAWTTKRKQEIINSRVDTTRKIAESCAALKEKSPRFFNASAIGVYGLQQQVTPGLPTPFDESSNTSGPATDFLSEVARHWEKATNPAEQAGVQVLKMRFGIVLDNTGGALPKIIFPFRLFLGGPIGTGNQPFTWISLSDLCSAIDFVIEKKDISGVINIVALKATSQIQLAHTIGKIMHRPSHIRIPALILKLFYGERAKELLLEGQHIVPKRLTEIGFEFQHPDIESALRVIVNT